MSQKWYVVHTYSGFENKVKSVLEERVRTAKKEDFFSEVLVPAEKVIEEVRAGVEDVERRVADELRQSGVRVLGRRRVLQQSWKDSPTSLEPRRKLRPRFAGSGVARVLAVLRYHRFLDAYRDARADWLAGRQSRFPRGTYWLARFASVPVVPLPA